MSDRPQHPTGDMRPDPADPARPSSPPDTAEPAGTIAGDERAPIARDSEAAAGAPFGEPPPTGDTASEPAETTARDEPAITEPVATVPFDEPPPAAAPVRRPDYRGLALGLALALLLILALVGTAPFWAPLLPWGDERAGTDPAVVERLDVGQQQIRQQQQQIAAATAAMPKLEQRVGALEQKPPAVPPELGEMRQQIASVSAGVSDLATRLKRVENAAQAQAAGVSDLATRLGRAEQAQQAQATDLAAKLGPLQQSLQAQQSAVTELGNRLQAVEKTAQSRAGDLTDMGLTLALMQIRNAVETGQPFPAQYEALSSLAKTRPEIAAAAAPLAAAAPTGTSNRVALAQELHVLEQKIGTAPAETDSGGNSWTGAALDRLRGLVRIRRADEAEPGKEAEAAVTVAERALAGGDLARAVATIETLQGPTAAAAADWLRKARERLAVEAALQRLEALLTGRLGDTAAIPGSPG